MQPPHTLFDFDTFIDKSTSMLNFAKECYDERQKDLILPKVEPGFLVSQFQANPPLQAMPVEQVYEEMKKKILPGILNWQSRKFFGYFPAIISDAIILADIFTLVFTTPAFNYSASPAHTEIENLVVDWTAKALGLPEKFHRGKVGAGVITSSASNSIFLAVHAAKILKLEKEKIQLNDPRSLKLVGYVTESAHIAGLRALFLKDIHYRRHVPIYYCQEAQNYVADLKKLEEMIKEDIAEGLIPFFYDASIGATETGAIDQIPEISDICKKYGIWLNIDAAYLGSTWICPEFRGNQKGIENVDSIAINFSKLGFIGMGGSLLFIADKKEFNKAMTLDVSFNLIKTTESEDHHIIDYRDWKVDLCKQPVAFRFYLLYRLYGLEKIREAYRWREYLAQRVQDYVKNSDIFELFSKKVYALICFRLKGENASLTEQFAAKIGSLQQGYLNGTNVKGNYIIRMSVAHYETTVEQIDEWWNKINTIALEFLESKKAESK